MVLYEDLDVTPHNTIPLGLYLRVSRMTVYIYIALEPHNLTMCCDFRTCPSAPYMCFGSFPWFILFFSDFSLKAGEDQYLQNSM
jgi:hypothetical protein